MIDIILKFALPVNDNNKVHIIIKKDLKTFIIYPERPVEIQTYFRSLNYYTIFAKFVK